MNTTEAPFAFFERLCAPHRPDLHSPDSAARDGDVVIDGSWRIGVHPDAPDLARRAAADLSDFFATSLALNIPLDADLPADAPRTVRFDAPGGVPEGYAIEVAEDRVKLRGVDAAQLAQASYRLERLLALREGPFLRPGTVVERPLFDRRLARPVVPGTPDGHLELLAHYGINGILVGSPRDIDLGTPEHLAEARDLTRRAAELGMRSYLVPHLVNQWHPDEAGAREHYEQLYGSLVAALPDLSGIVLIGETAEFPSRDPRTTGRPWLDSLDADRPSPGWFPCSDFPAFAGLVADVVQGVRDDVELVVWTYNWGFLDASLRVPLVAALPPTCTPMTTFEMFAPLPAPDGIAEFAVDYTLACIGPHETFTTEADAARRAGLRHYSMTCSGGNTWDIGVVPYLPMPQRWRRRWDAVAEAGRRGLAGTLETWTWGLWPSFVTELNQAMYTVPAPDFDALLESLLVRDVGPAAAGGVRGALQLFSDAWDHYVPTNEDQYGPARIGPSYPLALEHLEPFPAGPGDYRHPSGITSFPYDYDPRDADRLAFEIAEFTRARELFAEGNDRLALIADLVPEAKRPTFDGLLRLTRFIQCALTTIAHTKRWEQLKWRLGIVSPMPAIWAGGRAELRRPPEPPQLNPDADPREALEELLRIAEDEIANALAARPLVAADSRLGFEPEFGYGCSPEQIDYKVAALRRTIAEEIRPRL